MFGVLVAAFFLLLIVWFKFSLSYWERRGLPGPKPWPIVGNIGASLCGKETLGAVIKDIYKKYEGYPFVGIFRGTSPALLIRDPELVNRVLVKDFKSFRNNEFFVDKHKDPLLGNNPFVLRDQEWKDVRQMLTPGMTSGRMKHIFPLLKDITENFIKFVENHPTATTDGIETRGLTKRLTLDYVAKTAFGIDGKAFESYEEISEFNKLVNLFLTPGSYFSLVFTIGQVFPSVFKIASFKCVPNELEMKLMQIITDVTEYRKNNNVQANDYLQFLIELAKERNLSEVEITSHACTFFLDGYATASSVLTFLLLNLAFNPKYQKKIREEIQKCENENNNELTYESLHDLPWLNACFYESLRVTPPVDVMVKVCNEHYEYTSADQKFKKLTVKLAPGDIVVIPYGIVTDDETYFENARKFIPERMFKRDSFEKGSHYPFGDGPRMCIGQRLGILQVKLATAHILKHFELSVSPKLQQPITYMPYSLFNEVKGGVWIQYKKIFS